MYYVLVRPNAFYSPGTKYKQAEGFKGILQHMVSLKHTYKHTQTQAHTLHSYPLFQLSSQSICLSANQVLSKTAKTPESTPTNQLASK